MAAAEHVLKLAREHAVEALETLVAIIRDGVGPFSARIRCVEIILDRDLGRPVRQLSYVIEAASVASSWVPTWSHA